MNDSLLPTGWPADGPSARFADCDERRRSGSEDCLSAEGASSTAAPLERGAVSPRWSGEDPSAGQPVGDNNDRRPLFSIVMPAYKAERYIGDSIASIQAQTLGDWELVVVDDASPDGTAAVVRQFAENDSRIRLVSHEENKGAAQARNTGIDAARGLYIWLPDSDDTYDCDLLERCARALAENPAAITLFGVAETYLDEDGNVTRTHEMTFEECRCPTVQGVRALALPLERCALYGYSHNKVYDLDFLRSTGARYEDAPLCEDFFFNVRVFQDAPSLNVLGGAPYHYSKRAQGSLTRAFVPEYYPIHRRRIQEMRDQLASWGMLDDQAKAILGGLFARYILSEAEHTFDKRSGMGQADRKAWIEGVFADPLFSELVPLASADDPLLKACLVPFKRRQAGCVLSLGHAVHLVRDRAELIYSIARQGR